MCVGVRVTVDNFYCSRIDLLAVEDLQSTRQRQQCYKLRCSRGLQKHSNTLAGPGRAHKSAGRSSYATEQKIERLSKAFLQTVSASRCAPGLSKAAQQQLTVVTSSRRLYMLLCASDFSSTCITGSKSTQPSNDSAQEDVTINDSVMKF